MSIDMACPTCGQTFNLVDSLRGKYVRCLSCNDSFLVKDEEPFVCEEAVPAEDVPSSRRSRVDPRQEAKPASIKGLVIGSIGAGVARLAPIAGVAVATYIYSQDDGSKAISAKFRKVTLGMAEQDVVALLGSPTLPTHAGMEASAPKTMIWHTSKGHYSVFFLNGRVAAIACHEEGVEYKPPDWERIHIGMTDHEVRFHFGSPMASQGLIGANLIKAGVNEDDVKGPDGKMKTVYRVTYRNGPKAIEIVFVDGMVYKVNR